MTSLLNANEGHESGVSTAVELSVRPLDYEKTRNFDSLGVWPGWAGF